MRKSNTGESWHFELTSERYFFIAKLPNGSVIEVTPNTIEPYCEEYFRVQLGKKWPQVETRFDPPIILKNPLQAAFYDVMLLMSPGGIRIMKETSQKVHPWAVFDHISHCLNMIAYVSYGEFLAYNQDALATGQLTIPEAMRRLDSQVFSAKIKTRGDGWFEQSWNIVKEQCEIDSAV